MFLQKNSTSELHDQFPPCLKLKKYAEAKTHCTWQENGLPADINRQVLATSRGSLGKKKSYFQINFIIQKKNAMDKVAHKTEYKYPYIPPRNGSLCNKFFC